MAISGVGLASVAVGSVFLYAGIKGYSVPQAFQYILQGKSPTTLPVSNQITPSVGPGTAATNATVITTVSGSGGPEPGVSVSSGGSNKSVLKATAATFGWTDANGQWAPLNNIEEAEAGYSLTAKNPSSGAYGEAQFIDGPSEYYAYGGDPNTASGQAIAMCNYIKQRYGTPQLAWAFHLANGWY